MVEQFKQRDEILSSELPINNANDLLSVAHVVSVGATDNLSSDYCFELNWIKQASDAFFAQKDVFSIRLVKKDQAQNHENRPAL